MTTKAERLRQRLKTLQAELAETERQEQARAKHWAARSLRRAANRSGLAALLSSGQAISAQTLEVEFRHVTERLRARPDVRPDNDSRNESSVGDMPNIAGSP